MVASPYELLEDLEATQKLLQQEQQKKDCSTEKIGALKDSITNLSLELEQMGFQQEVGQVLKRKSAPATHEDAL